MLERVLDLAKAEVGYLEKASLSNLDSKQDNAGTANFTKYARDVDETDLFNGKKQGFSWCTTFVVWLFLQCYGAEMTQTLLYLPPKSLAAGCKFAVRYYQAAKAYGNEPKVGAQIFFADSSGEPCHTGIVTGFDETKVYTIEGNTSGASGVVANGGGVAAKTYRRSYSRIHGYGYPAYPRIEKENDMTKEEVTALLTAERTALTTLLNTRLAAAEQAADRHLRTLIDERIRAALSGKDTTPSAWAADELQAAIAAGITDGTRPQAYAKREEVAAMVIRGMRNK